MRSAVIGSGGKIIRRMVEVSGVTAMDMTDHGLELLISAVEVCERACVHACIELSGVTAMEVTDHGGLEAALEDLYVCVHALCPCVFAFTALAVSKVRGRDHLAE
eukprot:scaffold79562_cov24-Tisochrysis_lutea.AAC.2